MRAQRLAKVSALGDSQQPQDNEYDHDNDQYVDHVADAWDAGDVFRSKVAEQPQGEQYYDNQGKHERFFLNNRSLGCQRVRWLDSVELTVQQDEDASCNGEDRQNRTKAADPEKLYQAPGDEKDGQQEHADILCVSHGRIPF